MNWSGCTTTRRCTWAWTTPGNSTSWITTWIGSSPCGPLAEENGAAEARCPSYWRRLVSRNEVFRHSASYPFSLGEHSIEQGTAEAVTTNGTAEAVTTNGVSRAFSFGEHSVERLVQSLLKRLIKGHVQCLIDDLT
jgi:hypothetical protein